MYIAFDAFQRNDITLVTRHASGSTDEKSVSITPIIQKRALRPYGFSVNERRRIRNSFLPNKPHVVQEYGSKVFCGSYSKDGEFFITATQGIFASLSCGAIYKFVA